MKAWVSAGLQCALLVSSVACQSDHEPSSVPPPPALPVATAAAKAPGTEASSAPPPAAEAAPQAAAPRAKAPPSSAGEKTETPHAGGHTASGASLYDLAKRGEATLPEP